MLKDSIVCTDLLVMSVFKFNTKISKIYLIIVSYDGGRDSAWYAGALNRVVQSVACRHTSLSL